MPWMPPSEPMSSADTADGCGVFITGVPHYHASVPYLAYSTAAQSRHPVEFKYSSDGLLREASPIGSPPPRGRSNTNAAGRWVPPSADAQILQSHELPRNASARHLAQLERSPLHRLVLSYMTCTGITIEARYARRPMGPRGRSRYVLPQSNARSASIYCTLIMSPSGCPGLTSYRDTAGTRRTLCTLAS